MYTSCDLLAGSLIPDVNSRFARVALLDSGPGKKVQNVVSPDENRGSEAFKHVQYLIDMEGKLMKKPNAGKQMK
ncbi:hypothetical protein MUK42_36537 [Musa troglodytarum]|uniref:Uncharacterized protein n=1 Tax=Musa troglodytarum TaxID=320322 RepID=A0A9E7K8A9_9LILI|nr:hypothetical protein MUK42_36537 [Musa troglodytarum]